MTEEIVKYESESPINAMQAALTSGLPVEKIEKMLELQERWESNEAKKAFTKSMAAFKADPPIIKKDRHVKFGTKAGVTEYNHASLGNVTSSINRSLAKHGLSASWKTGQNGGAITVTCTITHDMGHSESTSLTANSETSGTKNSIQAVGSTISYLQRYTILALTGLATHEQDDDGAHAQDTYISEKQAKSIRDALEQTGSDEQIFLAWLGVDEIEKIPAGKFIAGYTALKKKASEKANPLHKTDAWAKWIEARDQFPEISEGMQEPATEEQCIEATKVVQRQINTEAMEQ